MAPTAPTQEFFDMWKKQMEDGAQQWARMLAQPSGSGNGAAPPDPLNLWRPFMEQATEAWTRSMGQAKTPSGPAEAAAQGKAVLDQWIAGWDKLLADTMQTEAFAEAMGKHLNQWLDSQAPIKKAATDSMENTLQALGVPSRNQVVGLARQMMDLDDRVEGLEDHLIAIREQLGSILRQRDAAQPAAPPAAATTAAPAGTPPAASRTRGGRPHKPTEKK